MQTEHDVPIGTLVEIIDGEDAGARLFVVNHSRDCDGEPLYDLGLLSDTWTIKDGKDVRMDFNNTQDRVRCNVHFHYGREGFRIVNKKYAVLNIETGEFSNSSNLTFEQVQELVETLNSINSKSTEKLKVILFNKWTFHHYHHKDCLQQNQCSPKCPKNNYELTGDWECYQVVDGYTTDRCEAAPLPVKTFKLIEFECLSDENFEFLNAMKIR